MSWHAKARGSYALDTIEAKENVAMISSDLTSDGWSLKSIAALLGNGAGESGLNPWRWESDYVPTYNEFLGWNYSQALSHGYGIFGFTPAYTYINSNNEQSFSSYGYGPNFSDRAGLATDGEAQVRYFMSTVSQNWLHNLYNYYADNFAQIGVDISTFYYMTFQQFKTATDGNGNSISIADLTGAFELCYEKPNDAAAASSYRYRVSQAEAWYEYLQNNPPTPVSSDTFNIMLYLKPRWKKF